MDRKASWALLAGGMVLACVAWSHFSLAQNGEGTGVAAKGADRRERIERLQEECRSLRARLGEAEAQHEALKQRIQARLTALYKFRALGYASALIPLGDGSSTTDAGHAALQVERADVSLSLRWHERLVGNYHLSAQLARRQFELESLQGQAAAAARPDQATGSVGGTSTPGGERDQRGAGLFKKIPHRKPIMPESAERFSALRGALPPPTVGEMVVTYGSKSDKKGESFLHRDGVTFVAPRGQAVEAVFDGIVVFSDWLKEYGNVMIVDHGEHYHSLVAHAEQLLKQVGDPVRRGEVVATVGSTGSSNKTQLYFEIRYHGRPVNPMEWLASGK